MILCIALDRWCSGLACFPVTEEITSSNLVRSARIDENLTKCDGLVAQLGEQRTENPRVDGSIPP